jgi:hypothetical protein
MTGNFAVAMWHIAAFFYGKIALYHLKQLCLPK